MNLNSDINEDFLSIDIKDIINSIVQRARMIALFAVVTCICFFLISKFVMVPLYEADVTLCVGNNKTMVSDGMDYNDVNASITLVPTYVELIQSNNILSEVAARTQSLGYDAEDIGGMLSVSAYEETQIIMLSIINPNPEHANIIANCIAEVAPEKIVELMEGTSVKVVDESELPTAPISPNVKKNTVLGFLFGAFIGIVIAILLSIFDNSIKEESNLTDLFPELPVLGIIPEFSSEDEILSKSEMVKG